MVQGACPNSPPFLPCHTLPSGKLGLRCIKQFQSRMQLMDVTLCPQSMLLDAPYGSAEDIDAGANPPQRCSRLSTASSCCTSGFIHTCSCLPLSLRQSLQALDVAHGHFSRSHSIRLQVPLVGHTHKQLAFNYEFPADCQQA